MTGQSVSAWSSLASSLQYTSTPTESTDDNKPDGDEDTMICDLISDLRNVGAAEPVCPPPVPAQAPADIPPVPFATLMLNGQVMARVPLPPADAALPEEQTVSFSVPGSVRIEGSEGSLHVATTLVVPFAIEARYRVTLLLASRSKDVQLVLGTLQKKSPVLQTQDFLKFMPVRGVAKIVRQEAGRKERVQSAEELRFLTSIVEVLKSPSLNPGGGSLSTAVLYNHAKAQPHFEVIGKLYSGNLLKFIAANSATLRHLQFSHHEIAMHKLAPVVRPDEPRIALARSKFLTKDAKRVRECGKHHKLLLNTLMEYFKGRREPVSQEVLLAALKDSSSFLFLAQPTLGVFQKFLQKHGFTSSKLPRARGTVTSATRNL